MKEISPMLHLSMIVLKIIYHIYLLLHWSTPLTLILVITSDNITLSTAKTLFTMEVTIIGFFLNSREFSLWYVMSILWLESIS